MTNPGDFPGDPTRRFTDRADSYAQCRPRYPRDVVELMKSGMGLTSESVIADVGSGTGILSELFLDNGNVVLAVEPNEAMRAKAEQLLARRPGFRSIDGRAEDTTLKNACADFVTAGQAFHWFEVQASRREFGRILKPGGFCVFVWNWRNVEASGFMRAYENLLLDFSEEYHLLKKLDAIEADLAAFFSPGRHRVSKFASVQELDLDGLKGRLRSVSYAPRAGDPRHKPMIASIERLFRQHEDGGRVRMFYDTLVYFGRLH